MKQLGTLWTVCDTEGTMHIVYGPEGNTKEEVADLAAWFLQYAGSTVGEYVPLHLQQGENVVAWSVKINPQPEGMRVIVDRMEDNSETDYDPEEGC